MIRKKLEILLLSFMLMFVVGVSYSFGQEKEFNLKDKRVTINAEKKPLNYIISYLIINYDIAFGFEEAQLKDNHNEYEFMVNKPYSNYKPFGTPDAFPSIKKHWFTINAEGEKLENVLDIVVRQMPNYKWEINDDIVNIFPIQGRDKRYENLLNLKIKSFSFKKNTEIIFIRDKIIDLPEIKKFLGKNNMLSTDARRYTDFAMRGLPNDIKFSDLTFRELLNKITKVKRGGWMLLNPYVLPKTHDKEYLKIEI